MSEEHRFREVRKGERGDVLAFAAQHGCSLKPDDLCHHLSLTAEHEGQTVAAALCMREGQGRFVIEIVVGESSTQQALIAELADRCLRKVQSEDIGAARVHSATQSPAELLWSSANWLDRVQETPPQQCEPGEDESSQAA